MTDLITEARGVKSVTEQAAGADIRNAVAAGETGVCGICGRRHPMSELKLLLCPFCGGEARLRYLKPFGWVQCKKCGATSAAVSDYYEETDGKGQAVAAWNRRAQPENSRQHALQTGVCPMCEDCPDGCPIEMPNDSRNRPENEPLTLSELRGMENDNDGTPIWIEPKNDYPGEWAHGWYIWPWDTKDFELDTYDAWWLAYRTKPERSEG